MAAVLGAADRPSCGTGPEPHACPVAHDGPEQRDDQSRDKLATLRADLRAAGWSAEVVRLSGEDRAEMVRDYGIEGA